MQVVPTVAEALCTSPDLLVCLRVCSLGLCVMRCCLMLYLCLCSCLWLCFGYVMLWHAVACYVALCHGVPCLVNPKPETLNPQFFFTAWSGAGSERLSLEVKSCIRVYGVTQCVRLHYRLQSETAAFALCSQQLPPNNGRWPA